jgi:hypothetical protein
MLLRKIIFQVILDQADLYTNLFSPLVEDFLCGRTVTDDSQPRPKRIVAIVMEYLRSLEERQIPVQVRNTQSLSETILKSEIRLF